ncbi:hypothetical protein F2Q69_00023426 [Brassica cretica]|uniref:Uncharacterized protein n=1 Tax=Brassica cretica TaxID=69181 RepID=A0A8S9QCS8_BRACR|nr:hypothetical protein F2Q69_00023426 [Brassica cretica]
MQPIAERMDMSKASHLSVPKHQRPPIWTEEAIGFHKRVKRIHDPVKIVVPCAVFETESPIPPDRNKIDKDPAEATSIDTDRIPSNDTNKPASIDAITSPSIDSGRVSEHKEFDVCGNLRDGDTTTQSDKSGGKKRRNWKKRKRIKNGPQVSLTPHFSDYVKKSRVSSRCFSKPFAKQPHCSRGTVASIDTVANKSINTIAENREKKIQGRRVDIPEAIDDNRPLSVGRASRVSIDRHLTVSIDAHHQRSDSTKDTKVDQPVNYPHLLRLFEGTKADLQH